MIPHWFRSPKALILIPILLLLLGAVACGPAEESAPEDTQAKDTAPSDTKTDTKTDVPVAKMEPTAMPVAAGTKLDRLIVAVSPMGWDSNYTYRVSTTGLLDKRPIQEHLIGIDRVTGAYEPQLATKWEMSPDGKDWTFTLRKGVPWHGEEAKPEGWGEFTAQDVRHTAFMHNNPDSVASNRGKWREITGLTKADRKAENPFEVIQNKVAKVVEIVDDYTAIIHSATVQPELFYYHSVNRGYPIVSKARYDELGALDIGQAIVGTGPLKFIERKEAQHVRYEALQDHWRMTPSYNELEFRWVAESATRLATLITGEVHLADIERALQGIAKDEGMKVIRSKFSGMNMKWMFYGNYPTLPEYFDPDLPWADVKVRRAMQKAVDTQGIVAALMPGTEVEYPAIYGFHPVLDEEMWPGIWNPAWFDDWEEYYGYDLDAAKKLLAEAGYPNGFEFELWLVPYSGLPEIVDIGQAVAIDLQKLGLTVKLVEMDFPTSSAKARKHDASGALRGSRSQHRTILSASSYSTVDGTSHPYTSVEMDEVIEELKLTVDPGKRAELLQKLGDIQYYDNARLQMFGAYVEMTVNPKYVIDYKFPATMSGYFSHLEYIETVPQ